jgi:hypothetical protein
MYSILILKSQATYQYYLNDDNTIYKAGTLGDVQAKVAELLHSYTLDRMVVVKNCIVTADITVEEAAE